MSTIREHIEDLRKIATTLEQRGDSGNGNRLNSQPFQFASALLCGVHLDELEAMANDRQPADLTDAQIKALVNDSLELAQLEYGVAYLLVRKIEAAANASGPSHQPQHWRFDATSGDPETGDPGDFVPVDAPGVPVRCKECDLPNGCPEYCWCDAPGAGKAEYASWFPMRTRGVSIPGSEVTQK